MSRSRGHGSFRIVIALALTGFAYAIAGRRNRRPGVGGAPTFPECTERPTPGTLTHQPTRRDPATEVLVTTLEASADVADIPASSPVSGPTPSPDLNLAPGATVETNSPAPDQESDTFDAVMTRVTTMLEAAARRCPARRQEASPLVSVARPTTTREVGGGGQGEDSPARPRSFTPFPPTSNGTGSASKQTTGSSGSATEMDDGLTRVLRTVGLDESLVQSVSQGLSHGGNLESLLLAAFGTLPPAPPVPRYAGGLLIVVGAGASARRLAAGLAGEMGIDPVAVPFASRDAGAFVHATGKLLVRSPEDAGERAPDWRRSRPAIVAVDAPVTTTERSWAASMIASLQPGAVWGVVDSTCKPEDIAAWAEILGRVDALALENVAASVSPAAALGAGLPVARLDGQPATAARWVAAIAHRVDAAA